MTAIEQIPEPSNPLGIDGLEFIEFATSQAQAFGALLEKLGFVAIRRHRSRGRVGHRSRVAPQPAGSRLNRPGRAGARMPERKLHGPLARAVQCMAFLLARFGFRPPNQAAAGAPRTSERRSSTAADATA